MKQESNVQDLRLSFRRSAGTISRGKSSPSVTVPSSMRPEHRHLSTRLTDQTNLLALPLGFRESHTNDTHDSRVYPYRILYYPILNATDVTDHDSHSKDSCSRPCGCAADLLCASICSITCTNSIHDTEYSSLRTAPRRSAPCPCRQPGPVR